MIDYYWSAVVFYKKPSVSLLVNYKSIVQYIDIVVDVKYVVIMNSQKITGIDTAFKLESCD